MRIQIAVTLSYKDEMQKYADAAKLVLGRTGFASIFILDKTVV